MSEGKWIAVGAFSATAAVGLGAFGAHVLEAHLDAARLNAFEVGVKYHLIHSIALILVIALPLIFLYGLLIHYPMSNRRESKRLSEGILL